MNFLKLWFLISVILIGAATAFIGIIVGGMALGYFFGPIATLLYSLIVVAAVAAFARSQMD